jgi:cytochrome c oxidase subunit 2
MRFPCLPETLILFVASGRRQGEASPLYRALLGDSWASWGGHRMRIVKWLVAVVVGCIFNLSAAPFLWAQGVVGAPHPWEMGMQHSYGPIKDRVIELHNLVLVIITAITLFVGGLLIWVMIRFNARRNPVPSQTSHNTILEIAWTVIPVLILVIIAIPSFRLIYYQDRTPDPDMTIKVTGHQWYWEYSYPDQGNFAVESRFIHDEDLKPGQLRLLDVDNQLVIPVGKKVRILTTSSDVIHSFFIPAFGVQRYAIPGRTIETWMEADRAGTFYGECNQICGQDHSRMPISVRAVSESDFKTWADETKKSAATGHFPTIASK